MRGGAYAVLVATREGHVLECGHQVAASVSRSTDELRRDPVGVPVARVVVREASPAPGVDVEDLVGDERARRGVAGARPRRAARSRRSPIARRQRCIGRMVGRLRSQPATGGRVARPLSHNPLAPVMRLTSPPRAASRAQPCRPPDSPGSRTSASNAVHADKCQRTRTACVGAVGRAPTRPTGARLRGSMRGSAVLGRTAHGPTGRSRTCPGLLRGLDRRRHDACRHRAEPRAAGRTSGPWWPSCRCR